MATYRRKLLKAVVLFLFLTVVVLIVGLKTALFVLFVGVVVILNRHLSRCESCFSWRTYTQGHFSRDDHHPSRGTASITRECSACGHREWLSEWQEFREIPYGKNRL